MACSPSRWPAAARTPCASRCCPRRRPAAAELPAYQTLASPPTSSSFPSGHAASAAAFATAVGLESPRLGLALAPLAAAVGYSRVHVGVHWTSDVAAGAALGVGVAALTRRWWPVRRTDEARARPVDSVPALPDGEGLLMMVNQFSGDPTYDPVADVARVLPRAEILTVQRGRGIDVQLEAALHRRGAEIGSRIKALGVTGGDGSVGAGAAVAERYGLPLVVVPLGTLNHFARDVGVYDLQEVDDATRAGQAVAVDLGVVEVHPPDGPRTTRSCGPGRSSTPRASAPTRSSCGCGSAGSRGGASGRRSSRR